MIITIDRLCRRECKTQDLCAKVPVLNWWSGQGALMPWSPLYHSVWNQCSFTSGFLSGLDEGDFNGWRPPVVQGFPQTHLIPQAETKERRCGGKFLCCCYQFQVRFYPAPLTSTPRVFNSVLFYGRLDIVRLEWLSAGNWCKSTKRSMTPVRRLCAPQWPIWKDGLYKCVQAFQACEPWFV